MGNSALLERLRGIVQEIFDSPDLKITPETSAADIQDWDSVAQVKLVLALEEAFDVQFSTEDVAGMKTVGDFIRVIQAKGIAT